MHPTEDARDEFYDGTTGAGRLVLHPGTGIYLKRGAEKPDWHPVEGRNSFRGAGRPVLHPGCRIVPGVARDGCEG